jgi:hypothetical protein
MTKAYKWGPAQRAVVVERLTRLVLGTLPADMPEAKAKKEATRIAKGVATDLEIEVGILFDEGA